MSSFHIETNNDAGLSRSRTWSGEVGDSSLTLLPALGDSEHDRHDRHRGHKHIEHESDDGRNQAIRPKFDKVWSIISSRYKPMVIE
jgi:hypothetical protein